MTETAEADRRLSIALQRWFARRARPLPWRTTPRDPYRSLVSEFMLQQTQVSRVVDRFDRFIKRFPTIAALAGAREDEVRALWSGLGYYRRAVMLHAAAKAVVGDHDGELPRSTAGLLTLPGVGAYTAGAVASMVFGEPAPAVDGNVQRVLMRISARCGTAAANRAWVDRRAGAIALAATSPGETNEALMELGATVCTPRSPRCAECPVASGCRALALGRASSIPAPARQGARARLFAATVVIRGTMGCWLIERRAASGLWAGMWQAPTIEGASPLDHAALARAFGAGPLTPLVTLKRTLTHRQVSFAAYTTAEPSDALPKSSAHERRWVRGRELREYALSTPQRLILAAAGAAVV